MKIISKDQAINLLHQLVDTPSFTYDESQACNYLLNTLPDFNWENTKIDEIGNVIAERGNGPFELILMGHIDTVLGGPKVKIQDDVLWGRGSVDAKGPLCTFIAAGGNAKIPDNWKLRFIAAVAEEGDSRGAYHVLPKYSPKGCVIGEPSGVNGVTIGYRGFLKIELTAQDTGAHRSIDSGAITACLMAAADILNEVENRDDPTKQVIDRPSGAIISMYGKEQGERTASIYMDIRLPLGADPKQWCHDFAEIALKRDVIVNHKSSMAAHINDKNSTLARVLRVAIRNAGLQPRILAKGGTADLNVIAPWNCPTVAYGPGDSKLDHTADEHIILSEYTQAITILTQAIENFMKDMK